MITTVLFDLDGTLLPMDMDAFTEKYFSLLAGEMVNYGYEPKELIGVVWAGTKAMVQNNGGMTNEEAFWACFCEKYGVERLADKDLFERYYRDTFDKAREACGFTAKAARAVREVRDLGCRAALATNPIFPDIATRKRAAWAGLSIDDFVCYTTYENARFCKPNIAYYKELLERLHAVPQECLMVGNDVDEDMIAGSIGMSVFLLTDCLINRRNADIGQYPHGDFDDLSAYIKKELRMA